MTSDEAPYKPIPCAIYSEYELVIMHRRKLRLFWKDLQQLDHLCLVHPLDLQTENHAEYLIARDSEGRDLKIRLDRIKRYHILERDHAGA